MLNKKTKNKNNILNQNQSSDEERGYSSKSNNESLNKRISDSLNKKRSF